jgi:hypothetical protein
MMKTVIVDMLVFATKEEKQMHKKLKTVNERKERTILALLIQANREERDEQNMNQ